MFIIDNYICWEEPNPKRITSQIKDVRVGEGYIGVPHTLVNAYILRGMGYAPPSPIISSYNFSGRFTPFKHQQETCAFLTFNRRAFILSGLGCIDGDAIIPVNRRGKSFKISLRDLYKRWVSPRKGSFGRDEWKCRSLKNGMFGLNKIENVVYKGTLPTIEITLEDGKRLRCTIDHQIALPDNKWKSAGDLQVGDLLVTNGKKMAAVVCPQCGEARLITYYNRKKQEGKLCRKCTFEKYKTTSKREGNPSWRGGDSFIDKDGYVKIYMPDHPRAAHGRVYEHILVAEKKYNCSITIEMHIHHINGVRHDNRPENLELITPTEHFRKHNMVTHLDGGRTINGGVIVLLPKYLKITNIKNAGVTDVYDLTMQQPYHNYVANGVVVHNSGKTLSALWASDYLKSIGIIRKVLIVSPLSTINTVWADTLFLDFPHRKFAVVYNASAAKRKDILKKDADYYITNHHGVKILQEMLEQKKDIDLIIIDELAVFRNKTTDLWKSMKAIIKEKQWVWGLTGSPTPQAPTDAYAQMKLIKPDNYTRSFTKFKQTTMFQASTYKWVARQGAEEIAASILQPSIRHALRDCVDLPPTIKQDRYVELSPQQKKHYFELVQKSVTEVNDVGITAVNAAVLLGKISQAACGVIYGDNKEVLKIDFGPRLQVVKEIIDECNEKVILFIPLTGTLHVIAEELKKHFSCEIIEGATSINKRTDIFRRFQTTDSPKVIIANPQAIAHGVTLTAASTIVWYTAIWSAEYYEQACGRIVRPGQKNVTNIIHIYGTPVEKDMYEAVRNKIKLQDVILKLIEGEKK